MSFHQSHDADLLERPVDEGEGDEETGVTIISKSGNWRLRDRYDRWLGVTGYLSQIEAKL